MVRPPDTHQLEPFGLETLDDVAAAAQHAQLYTHALQVIVQGKPELDRVAIAAIEAPSAYDAPIPMLHDPVPEVRWTAANALGRVADSAAMSPLVVRLQDEYGEVRRQAALSLGYLGAGTARETLLELASGDPVAAVREAAAYAASLVDEPIGTERKSIEEPWPTSN